MGRKRRRIGGSESSGRESQGVCFSWQRSGGCAHGEKCKFIHGEVLDDSKRVAGDRSQATIVKDALSVPLLSKRDDMKAPIRRPRLVEDHSFSCLFHKDGHVKVLQHGNGLRVLFLAEGHPARRKGDQMQKVIYTDSFQNMVVSGKKKRGAPKVRPETVVLSIEFADGSDVPVIAGVSGKVIEVNKRLRNEPNLIWGREGYFAIVAPLFGIGKQPNNDGLSGQEGNEILEAIKSS